MRAISPGLRFRQALSTESPLQIVGAINPYCALMAASLSFQALYLSGAGVANASYGLPDLGMTNLNDVLIDLRRLVSATDLPILVDIDTGWGHQFCIARTIQEMIAAGAAAVHIEDQIEAKRCGHRAGKSLVSQAQMVDRIKAAVDARTDADFVIMARSDAYAVEGLQGLIDRLAACIEAGADMVFPEAMASLDEYEKIVQALKVPVLANITEFGKTPLFTREELARVGIAMVLHPLSAFRAMNAAALTVYETIRETGAVKTCLSSMQTRDKLYDFLNYYYYEQKISGE